MGCAHSSHWEKHLAVGFPILGAGTQKMRDKFGGMRSATTIFTAPGSSAMTDHVLICIFVFAAKRVDEVTENLPGQEGPEFEDRK